MFTLREAAAAIRKKETTPVELVRRCFDEIDRRDADVKAWVFVDRERAMADAERLTREIETGHDRGPLHGMPLGIKDIIDVGDWPTAAGSWRWRNAIAREDAAVVARLRRGGAVFLGKTVTTPFAAFDPPTTRNPHNLGRTPGGSSSGSAAAVAAGMCLGSLGTQTGGSIIRPASYCGVAGCKPTYGLLPVTGIVPFSESLDHPGPLARTVDDLRTMLKVLAGPALRPGVGVASVRLGRVRGMFDRLAEPVMRDAVDAFVETLRAANIAVDDTTMPESFDDLIPRHYSIMCCEGAAWHRERFERTRDDYPPKISAVIEHGLSIPAAEYIAARQHQADLAAAVDRMLEAGPVSFLLSPAATGPAPGIDTTGSPACNSPWSYLGLPTVTFPMGKTSDGLPLGAQITGPRHGDLDVLAVAEMCERVVSAWP